MMKKSSKALKIYIMVFFIFLYAPAVLLPIFAFNDGSTVAFPLQGFTTKWFGALRETEALHAAAKNSFFIAISTAVLSTSLGLLAARANARYKFPLQKGIMGFIMIPMVLPEIIVGVSLLVVMSQMGMYLSLWTIVLGHTLICTPFSIAILSSAFLNLDHSLEEASFDLGQTKLATFWLIIIPLIMPGLIASMLIAFTISLDEFIIAFFLAGTDPTLPVYIWGQVRFPQKLPTIMALGTLLLTLSLTLLITAEYMRRRGLRKTGTPDTGGFL